MRKLLSIQSLSSRLPDNTNYRGKYHRIVDLLFDWFGLDQTIKTVVHSKEAK